MAVYINAVESEPDYGSLPAAKIIDYPLEKRDYKPFAQAQLALGPSALFVRLIAFETRPGPESRMMLLLRLQTGCLCLSVGPAGEPELLPAGLALRCHRIAGEDLQGIFWGAECALPREPLEALLSRPLRPGETIEGNILKTSKGSLPGENGSLPGKQALPGRVSLPAHFGCLFPCRPVYAPQECGKLRPEDFGPLEIVNY